ncbi:ABC transporter substrate-binding protein [Amycolatopsis nigrescens]|uniref:ABC transporter substrate-binding protein n=1 Tax=Amycolatopsis nigrescens TaxID=381445 RepID=UPI00037B255A|nr:iron-siderophore ABC transporter substrate-binding protein [Amycolatopsis nigrescens]
MTSLTRPRRSRIAGRFTALSAALCVTVTGCAGGDEQGAGGDQAAAPGGFPRTVQHAMGETTIEKQPQTVAALDASYIGAALSLETKLVAYTKYRSQENLPDYLGDDRKYGDGARMIGDLESPDIEQLYDIKPDLIVSAKIRHEKIYNELGNVAPTVFSQTTGATWKENIRMLAKALGKEQLGEQKIGAFEQRAKRLGDSIRAKLGRNPSITLARFTEGEPTVRLYSSASFPGIVLADTGLKRPDGQPDKQDKISVDISQEDIPKLDADQIFTATYSDPSKDAVNPKDQFKSNPLWGTLKGKISEVDDLTWLTSVSLQGAHHILDDLATQFEVDPAR